MVLKCQFSRRKNSGQMQAKMHVLFNDIKPNEMFCQGSLVTKTFVLSRIGERTGNKIAINFHT